MDEKTLPKGQKKSQKGEAVGQCEMRSLYEKEENVTRQ